MKKRVIGLVLCLIMVMMLAPTEAFASLDSKAVVSFSPVGLKLTVNLTDSEEPLYNIDWEKISGTYYLFLPADCDRSGMTVFLNTQRTVTVGTEKIVDGEKTDVFAEGNKFTVKCGNKEYPLEIIQSQNIPSLYITTEEGEMDKVNADKDYKTSGTVGIVSDGDAVWESPKELKSIKGRGNSTWNNPKKPYNIKFDSKEKILGMDKAKKWTLLACYSDDGILHNPLAWEVAKDMNLPFTSDYRAVDLYINHAYNGTYIICESVEIGKNRVDIEDLTEATEAVNEKDLEEYPQNGIGNHGAPSINWVDIPNNPEDITGGYLLECDYQSREEDEVSGFITSRGQAVTIKEPEYASKEQAEYISEYWQDAEDALASPDGYNEKNLHYSEYFDMDSLVDMYLFLELSGGTDAGLSSTYFYKDKGGKIVAGPVWDNDKAFGYCKLRHGVFINDPSIWWASKRCYGEGLLGIKNMETPTIFNWLFRHEDFRQAASQRWNELRKEISYDTILDEINAIKETVKPAAMMNGVRWKQLDTEPEYNRDLRMTQNYLKARIEYLDKGFGEDAAYLFYDPNGGSGWVSELAILTKGDKVLIRNDKNHMLGSIFGVLDARSIEELIEIMEGTLKAPESNLKFTGWNTKADGTGKTYQPGEIITIRDSMTLYAQWGEKAAVNCKVNQARAAIFDNAAALLMHSLISIIKAGAI